MASILASAVRKWERTLPTDPSDALVDLCCSIFEDRLRWIDWSKCTSKHQELVGDKNASIFGSIKREMKSLDIQADTSSEVLLQYALTRRALPWIRLTSSISMSAWPGLKGSADVVHVCAAPRCGAHHPAISCEKHPGKPQS